MSATSSWRDRPGGLRTPVRQAGRPSHVHTHQATFRATATRHSRLKMAKSSKLRARGKSTTEPAAPPGQRSVTRRRSSAAVPPRTGTSNRWGDYLACASRLDVAAHHITDSRSIPCAEASDRGCRACWHVLDMPLPWIDTVAGQPAAGPRVHDRNRGLVVTWRSCDLKNPSAKIDCTTRQASARSR